MTNLGQKGLCSSMWVELGVTHNVTSGGRAPVPDIKTGCVLVEVRLLQWEIPSKMAKDKITLDFATVRNAEKTKRLGVPAQHIFELMIIIVELAPLLGPYCAPFHQAFCSPHDICCKS